MLKKASRLLLTSSRESCDLFYKSYVAESLMTTALSHLLHRLFWCHLFVSNKESSCNSTRAVFSAQAMNEDSPAFSAVFPKKAHSSWQVLSNIVRRKAFHCDLTTPM